jgi:hypothetical protein
MTMMTTSRTAPVTALMILHLSWKGSYYFIFLGGRNCGASEDFGVDCAANEEGNRMEGLLIIFSTFKSIIHFGQG